MPREWVGGNGSWFNGTNWDPGASGWFPSYSDNLFIYDGRPADLDGDDWLTTDAGGSITVNGNSSLVYLGAPDHFTSGYSGWGRLYVLNGGKVNAWRMDFGYLLGSDGWAQVAASAELQSSILVVGVGGRGSMAIYTGGLVMGR
jgi:hypothetical protein